MPINKSKWDPLIEVVLIFLFFTFELVISAQEIIKDSVVLNQENTINW
jgi:hypothetical protein